MHIFSEECFYLFCLIIFIFKSGYLSWDGCSLLPIPVLLLPNITPESEGYVWPFCIPFGEQ